MWYGMGEAITSFRGEYGFLSNMYGVEVVWDGRTYRNTESAFQSAKVLSAEERDEFCGLSGVMAKRKGRRVSLRPDWETVKDGIMEEVVRAKFEQHPELAEKLAATGDAPLMEGNAWHDTYWGVDSRTLRGENRLGEILMKVRAELTGGAYAGTAAQARAEKEEAEARAREAAERERREILEQLDAIPPHKLVGMEVGTRGFGRGRIIRRDGHYLTVRVGEQEKKFALPGCFVQGFLIPDDPSVTEDLKKAFELEARLEKLEGQ